MWNTLLTLIFPEQCVGCNKTGSSLCAICERTITTKPRALSGTVASLFDYKNPLVKKAIWALKYGQKKGLGVYFGVALYREFFKHLSRRQEKVAEEILLIPIPSNIAGTRKRGYNHAEVIAQSIIVCAKNDGLELKLSHALFKKKEVMRQVEAKNKMRRQKNIEEAFGIREGEVLTGKTLILIDDVITSGATMDEARRVLRQSKPKRILCIAVAH